MKKKKNHGGGEKLCSNEREKVNDSTHVTAMAEQRGTDCPAVALMNSQSFWNASRFY